MSKWFKSFFRGGIHPNPKKVTNSLPIVEFPVPAQVSIPLVHHIGASCEALVKKGDFVKVGQVIADSNQFVSAPIHSSVSGKVRGLEEVRDSMGRLISHLVIDTDGEQTWWEELRAPLLDSQESFLNEVRKAGLVGLGGAGFPTHVKLQPLPHKPATRLIINAAECEPYLSSDHRIILEKVEEWTKGIEVLVKWLHFNEIVIGIEDNKKDASHLLKKHIQERFYNGKNTLLRNIDDKPCKISVKVFPTSYPQGAEKTLIYACFKEEVPLNGLPLDLGIVMLNISTVTYLGQYLLTGLPVVDRVLTVAGEGIEKVQNIRVPLGTPYQDILTFVGMDQIKTDLVITGGPMMGSALHNLRLGVIKPNNGLLALSKKEAPALEESACIRCGTCHEVCPMNLLPKGIIDAVQRDNIVRVENLGLAVCMECGACTYACPANIPLAHYLKLGKQKLKDRGQ